MRPPRRRSAIQGYIDYLEREQAPKARGSFRLGREKFEQKLKLDEGISLASTSCSRSRSASSPKRRRSSGRSRAG